MGGELPYRSKARSTCHSRHGEIEERQIQALAFCDPLQGLIKTGGLDDVLEPQPLRENRLERRPEEVVVIGDERAQL